MDKSSILTFKIKTRKFIFSRPSFKTKTKIKCFRGEIDVICGHGVSSIQSRFQRAQHLAPTVIDINIKTSSYI